MLDYYGKTGNDVSFGGIRAIQFKDQIVKQAYTSRVKLDPH